MKNIEIKLRWTRLSLKKKLKMIRKMILKFYTIYQKSYLLLKKIKLTKTQ